MIFISPNGLLMQQGGQDDPIQDGGFDACCLAIFFVLFPASGAGRHAQGLLGRIRGKRAVIRCLVLLESRHASSQW